MSVKLVLLPGHEISTKTPVHDIALSLLDSVSSVVIHHYGHWDTHSFVSEKEELSRIQTLLSSNEPYILFAFSEGGNWGLKALSKGSRAPHASIYVGAPASVKKHHQKLKTPTLFLPKGALSSRSSITSIKTFLKTKRLLK